MNFSQATRGIVPHRNISNDSSPYTDPAPVLDITRQTGYSLDEFTPRQFMSGIGGSVRDSDKMQRKFATEHLSSWEDVESGYNDQPLFAPPMGPTNPSQVNSLVDAYRTPSQRMDESRRKLPATRMQRGRLSEDEQKKILLQRGRRLGYTGRNLSWRKDNSSLLRSDVKPKYPNKGNWFRPRHATDTSRSQSNFSHMQCGPSGSWNQTESIMANAVDMVLYGH